LAGSLAGSTLGSWQAVLKEYHKPAQTHQGLNYFCNPAQMFVYISVDVKKAIEAAMCAG